MTALGRDTHPCLRGGDIGTGGAPSFLHQAAAEISGAEIPSKPRNGLDASSRTSFDAGPRARGQRKQISVMDISTGFDRARPTRGVATAQA
jgi:hypothetical protein